MQCLAREDRTTARSTAAIQCASPESHLVALIEIDLHQSRWVEEVGPPGGDSNSEKVDLGSLKRAITVSSMVSSTYRRRGCKKLGSTVKQCLQHEHWRRRTKSSRTPPLLSQATRGRSPWPQSCPAQAHAGQRVGTCEGGCWPRAAYALTSRPKSYTMARIGWPNVL